MTLCNECQMNKIPSGCEVPIREMEVKKGVGVTSCKYFMELNGDMKKAYKVRDKIITERRNR